MNYFDKKIIWVTGASSGIGCEIAIQLSKYDCTLILTARRKEQLEDTKQKCGNANVQIHPFDLSKIDEIDDFSSLKLETHVNGKLMQSALAGEMIFSLSELIAYISNLLPLNPGDIVATGSPDGTGGSRNPTAFLNSGDCVEVSVDRIGTLKNHVGP